MANAYVFCGPFGFVCGDFDGIFRHLAARIREILENVGLAQESLPSSVVGSAQVLASVANLLNIRDTELSRCVLLENIVLLWIHLDFEIMY